MSDMQTRQQLLARAERDEDDLEKALVDVKRAVQRPLAIGSRVGEHIGAHPAPWLAAGVLVGLWLGSRKK
ncbi:MAG TPA: hypothetical protein VL049_29750 [Candidatus Dormibacteraeota bacterium]|nr:hypothetical protein [Candidatus Dormibacteraeota bacterium]